MAKDQADLVVVAKRLSNSQAIAVVNADKKLVNEITKKMFIEVLRKLGVEE